MGDASGAHRSAVGFGSVDGRQGGEAYHNVMTIIL